MIAWLDCTNGVAGDMLLGALLDLGVDAAAVTSAVPIGGFTLRTEPVVRGGFRALHAVVETQRHTHPHRPYSDVQRLLSGVSGRAGERARAVYHRLAEAEARLHGMPIDEVELHEVGAVDAIVDVVGVCVALEELGVDELVATALPMGGGTVEAAHGALPLPAPATLELVRGWPVTPAPPGEWVTPTGAALVTTLARSGGVPEMVPQRIGYGAGTRNPAGRANLVRVCLGTAPGPGVVELATNLDDMTGELVGVVLQQLLDAGALDAWATPVVMKKGRPGVVLSVLARAEDADALSTRILRTTSTLGVRRRSVERDVLDRWFVPVETPYGPVRIKVGGRQGEVWHAAPELADVVKRAELHGVPTQTVYAAAVTAWGRSSAASSGSAGS